MPPPHPERRRPAVGRLRTGGRSAHSRGPRGPPDGDSLTFAFVPRVPGAFMYHCGTAPVAAHIANGMYGAIIIDPVTPRPRAREFILVQSEFYLGSPAGPDSVRALDWPQLLDRSPDHVVFNGVPGQYAGHPLEVAPDELLRFYVVNAGPNRVSAFHVVGAIVDRVIVGGFGAPIEGVQTYNVPVGGGAIVELRLAAPGIYPFVSHAFADATKGAVGMLKAGNVVGTISHEAPNEPPRRAGGRAGRGTDREGFEPSVRLPVRHASNVVP